MFPIIITDTRVTIYDPEKKRLLSVESDQQTKFERVVELLRNERYADALVAARPEIEVLADKLIQQGDHIIEVRRGVLYIDGKVSHIPVIDVVMRNIEKGLPHEFLLKFAANLSENPSMRARKNLLEWLNRHKMPITDDGHFIAFKAVRPDLWDHHTGKTFHHLVGARISMPREDVCDDPDIGCSSGAHFASEGYALDYRSNSVICVLKVNPRDVVSIPKDYGLQKGRACLYEVMAHVSNTQLGEFNASRSRDFSFEDLDLDYSFENEPDHD